MDACEFNKRRSYAELRLGYRLNLSAPTSASGAISAVAELLVYFTGHFSQTATSDLRQSFHAHAPRPGSQS